jgi:predicted small metal-binding protein
MTKVLKCSDVTPGCNFEIRGNSEDEVLKKANEHAKTAHNMQSMPPEVLSKDNARQKQIPHPPKCGEFGMTIHPGEGAGAALFSWCRRGAIARLRCHPEPVRLVLANGVRDLLLGFVVWR